MDKHDLVRPKALAVQQRIQLCRVGTLVHDVRIANRGVDVHPQAPLARNVHRVAQQEIAKHLLGALRLQAMRFEVAPRVRLRHRLDVQSRSVGDDRLEGDRPIPDGRLELLLVAPEEARPRVLLRQQVANEIVRAGHAPQANGRDGAQLLEGDARPRAALVDQEDLQAHVRKQAAGPPAVVRLGSRVARRLHHRPVVLDIQKAREFGQEVARAKVGVAEQLQ